MTLALTLFLCWLSLWLLSRFKPQAGLNLKYMLLLLLLPFVIYPFVYSPLWWLRGLTGDLSIISLLVLALAVTQQLSGSDRIREKERQLLEMAVVALGLCFYPLALGLGAYDPYVLGYADSYFTATVILAAFVAIYSGYKTIAIMLLLALLSWNIQLLQSANLWDYLIDPFIFFFYLGRVLRRLIREKRSET